ncbi:hypothetical protein [Kosmotoga pacifica]|nr:hypothetical protein [Kosmotoga pacifica]
MSEFENDRFNALIDDGMKYELSEEEKAELRRYVRFVNMMRERTSYRPSESAKLKTLSSIRKKKLFPYRVSLAVAASAVILILGLGFFMENSILITPKPVFMLNNGEFDSVRKSLLSISKLDLPLSSIDNETRVESSTGENSELKKHLETTINFIVNREEKSNMVVLSTTF